MSPGPEEVEWLLEISSDNETHSDFDNTSGISIEEIFPEIRL